MNQDYFGRTINYWEQKVCITVKERLRVDFPVWLGLYFMCD